MLQRSFEFRRWGGKRRGAGRPAKGRRASERHKRRPWHDRHHPVHVTLRVLPVVGSLRRRHAWRAVRRAVIRMLERTNFRVCHYSIQGNHIHLIVEADDVRALARGMQGFSISCARHLNGELSRLRGEKRRGQVFADRYHPVVLKSPRQVRHALGYVLNNWRRHREDRDRLGRRDERAVVDVYSSGRSFDGWDRDVDRRIRPDDDIIPVAFAQTYLLGVGWRRHGRISPRAVPGPARSGRVSGGRAA